MSLPSSATLGADLLLVALGLLATFLALRPGILEILLFERVDPRPAALVRIAFGLAVLWTFLDLTPNARLFLSDEGFWLTDGARSFYGGSLKVLWDREHGFEHWWDPLRVVLGHFTILHVRSDPPFVFVVYGLALASLSLMVLGVWTRATTVASWILVEQLYRYTPIYYTGADLVVRVFFFIGLFCAWGEAYSIDSWRRRRAAVLGGAELLPPLRRIPAWPQRLMMLQLACIYCTTGLLKSGETWYDGTALYYALNGDHFYRIPTQAVVAGLQRIGVLPLATWVTHAWEVLFPLALVGAALRGYEAYRHAGRWPTVSVRRRLLSWGVLAAAWGAGAGAAVLAAAAQLGGARAGTLGAAIAAAPAVGIPLYRWLRAWRPGVLHGLLDWALGKRLWLGLGVAMHLGIDLGMNVGTFSQLMIAVYFAWLSGAELDGFWRLLRSRALGPGEGARPRRRPWLGRMLAPLDRLRFRGPVPARTVGYHPDEASVRRAALLRLWGPQDQLRFVADPATPSGTLRVQVGREPPARGPEAALALLRIFPGLWWLWAASRARPLRASCGRLGLRLLGQARRAPAAPAR